MKAMKCGSESERQRIQKYPASVAKDYAKTLQQIREQNSARMRLLQWRILDIGKLSSIPFGLGTVPHGGGSDHDSHPG